MQLHQIRHFIAVAEAGSFTRGAERVSVSQPALSASIAKLESEFGVRLFERNRRRVLLTAAGQRLLEASRNALQIFHVVKSELKANNLHHLRIAVARTAPINYLSNLIPSFIRAHPGIVVRLVEGAPMDIFRYLDHGLCHVALSVLKTNDRKYASRQLFEESYVLIVGNEHRFAQRETVSISELNDEPYILRTCCDQHYEAEKEFARRDIRPRIIYRTDHDDRAVALAASGLGVTLMPESFRSEHVKAVRVTDLGLHFTLGLQWLPGRDTKSVTQFVDFASGLDWRVPNALPTLRATGFGRSEPATVDHLVLRDALPELRGGGAKRVDRSSRSSATPRPVALRKR
jgi:DNA-binding transcriptional LysR family regulator